MIYRKHPIRSLLTSLLRKASILYPSDVYALSFEKRATENYIFKFLTVSSVSSDSIVKESLMTLSTRLWKLPKSTSKKQTIYNILLINMTQSCQIKQRYTFHLYPRTTCSQIYFRFSSYLLRKPHVFVILTTIGWFIVSIQSDLFWHPCFFKLTQGSPTLIHGNDWNIEYLSTVTGKFANNAIQSQLHWFAFEIWLNQSWFVVLFF
jgi:hypothetical protein